MTKPAAGGGKKIKLDDPIPPEYASPLTSMDDDNDSELEKSRSSNSSQKSAVSQNGHEYGAGDQEGKQYSEAAQLTPVSSGRGRSGGKGGRQKPLSSVHTTRIKRNSGVHRGNSSSSNESGLFYLVKNGKLSLQQIVDDWISQYKINQDAALLMLMQFFIRAAGCKGQITLDMQASMEHATIIRRMTEEFDEQSWEYPLIMSGQQWKLFRSNFSDFIQELIKQCQYSIIYDQYLMDNVVSLLTGLSDSQVRAFRHTATLAAMKLMTALVDVASTVSVNLENCQRQYGAEKAKSKDKRAIDRLESLLMRKQELEDNIDEIKNMLSYMFKSVFVHRYRDTLPEIRGICILEMGLWMMKFEQIFLDDSYLKYIGWTLHDKVGDVRLKCLQALQPLYASEELKNKLELFSSKFKDRVVSMTLDKELDVAVQAIKLMISILKYHRNMLTDRDCEYVYELVYSSHWAVAQAAGEFLNERLFIPDQHDDVANCKSRKGKKRRRNILFIRDLVQFFIESELHEHGAYLVDSLIESNEMLKDWEAMTGLLFEEAGSTGEPLDDRQETSLIDIMVCAVKQAATGEPPIGRAPNRKVLSAKELRQVAEDKNKLTEHFIVTLPLLLSKYAADPEKVSHLMLIPQYFDLELYKSLRQEKHLESLLKMIRDVVEKHTDSEVLDTCAKTLNTLCSEEFAIVSCCDLARSTLLDTVVNKFKAALEEYSSVVMKRETPDEEKTFVLVTSLKTLSIFSSCHDLGPWEIWPVFFSCITDSLEDIIPLPSEAVRSCIIACYFGIIWEMNQLDGVMGAVPAEIKNSIKSRLESFMELCESLMTTSEKQIFREEAYLSICDLLIVFCRQLKSNSVTASLVYEPCKALQENLNNFVENHVFVEEDEDDPDEHGKIQELHKRRNFLASFCKLVVYNVLPIKGAADVFKNYVRFYNDYGDIIKMTIAKAREMNKVSCARTMILSLSILFRDLKTDGRTIGKNREVLHGLKDLAKRFALLFGLDAAKNREAITALHREGILFSLEPAENSPDPTGLPPNIAFLEILVEFTNKLLKQDKGVVLNYLDRRVSSCMPSSQNAKCRPYLMYRNSLIQKENGPAPKTAKRLYSGKKKDVIDEEETDATEDDQVADNNSILASRRDSMSSMSSLESFTNKSLLSSSVLSSQSKISQKISLKRMNTDRYSPIPNTTVDGEFKRCRRETSRHVNYLEDLFEEDEN